MPVASNGKLVSLARELVLRDLYIPEHQSDEREHICVQARLISAYVGARSEALAAELGATYMAFRYESYSEWVTNHAEDADTRGT